MEPIFDKNFFDFFAPLKHAWFSAVACEKYGYVVYPNEKGEEVFVTAVSDSPDDSFYKWPDKVYLGLVKDRFIRSHKQNSPESLIWYPRRVS